MPLLAGIPKQRLDGHETLRGPGADLTAACNNCRSWRRSWPRAKRVNDRPSLKEERSSVSRCICCHRAVGTQRKSVVEVIEIGWVFKNLVLLLMAMAGASECTPRRAIELRYASTAIRWRRFQRVCHRRYQRAQRRCLCHDAMNLSQIRRRSPRPPQAESISIASTSRTQRWFPGFDWTCVGRLLIEGMCRDQEKSVTGGEYV